MVDRREILQPGQLSAAETARRLMDFTDALERKVPGASRWIDGYQPFIDTRGHWQPGAILRDRPGPLTVREARAITTQRMERSPR